MFSNSFSNGIIKEFFSKIRNMNYTSTKFYEEVKDFSLNFILIFKIAKEEEKKLKY